MDETGAVSEFVSVKLLWKYIFYIYRLILMHYVTVFLFYTCTGTIMSFVDLH